MTGHERRLVAGGMVSVRDAARHSGISRSRMYELIAGAVLTHARIAGRIVVSRAALDHYIAQSLSTGAVA